MKKSIGIKRQPTLRVWVDTHKGEKALVCGMGTSIDQYSVEFYENWPGFTIGVNEITDLFEPDNFFPNFNYFRPGSRVIRFIYFLKNQNSQY